MPTPIMKNKKSAKTVTASPAPIKMGSRAEEKVACANCKKMITVGERHSFRSKTGADLYFCADCIKKINLILEKETKNPQILTAVGFGIAAGLLCSFIWYFFTIITEFQIGYLAIGVGYLIGKAVFIGSGKRRGGALPGIAVAITILSLTLAEAMILVHFTTLGIQKKTPGATHISEWTVARIFFFHSSEFRMLFMTQLAKSIFSPITLLIWGFGIFTSYRMVKPRRI